MPQNYDSDIPIEELTQAMSQSNVAVQQVRTMLDDVRNKIGGINELLKVQRDYTRDELKQMSDFRDLIGSVGGKYRDMNRAQIGHMNDLSATLKAAEDNVKSFTREYDNIANHIKSIQEQQGKINTLLSAGINLKSQGGRERQKELRDVLKVRAEEKLNGIQLRRMAEERVTTNSKEIDQLNKLKTEKSKEIATAREGLDLQQKNFKLLERRFVVEQATNQVRARRRGGFDMSDALDVASDLRLPGTGTAALISRYASKGRMAGIEAAEAAGGGEAGAGMFGGLGGLGMLGGAALGLGVAAGGYTALQGYRAFRMAPQMGNIQRTLAGMGGMHGMRGATGAAMDPRLVEMGFGGMENLAFQVELARNLGMRSGPNQIADITRLGVATGQDRGAIAAQAGGLMMAGSAAPQNAAKGLEQVLSEGVRSGVDKALLTHFTQEVLNLQQELLQTTGENNAAAIAKSLGDFFKASGRGEAFFRGPEMRGLMGLSGAMQGVARGGGGPLAGTVYRAFRGLGGQGLENMDPLQRYFELTQFLEGGLFGGGQLAGNKISPVQRAKALVGGFVQESGGSRQVAALRAQTEGVMGVNQFMSLASLLDEIEKGTKSSVDVEKELANIMENTKDPLLRMLSEEARQADTLMKLTDRIAPAILLANQTMSVAQVAASKSLEGILGIMRLTREGQQYESNQNARGAVPVEPRSMGQTLMDAAVGNLSKMFPGFAPQQQLPSGFVPGVRPPDKPGAGALSPEAMQKLHDSMEKLKSSVDRNSEATEDNTNKTNVTPTQRGNGGRAG